MLDMTGYKLKDEESLQAEVIARKILAEEIDGDYDIGALIGADRKGNLWIYSSEEAKEQAYQEGQQSMAPPPAPAAAAPAAAASTGITSEDTARLAELGKLHEQGVLTDEEFSQEKAKILGL